MNTARPVAPIPPALESGTRLCSDGDDEILSRASRGDRAAFDVLARRHWRTVFLAAYRSLANGAEAEEVTQEAFVRVFVKLPPAAFETEGGFAAYLGMAVRRIIIDRHRHRIGHVERAHVIARVFVSFDEEDDSRPDEAAPADEQLEAHETLTGLLDQLTPRGRRVVELVIEGLLYREIAKELGIGAPSVCKFVAKARELLAAGCPRHAR